MGQILIIDPGELDRTKMNDFKNTNLHCAGDNTTELRRDPGSLNFTHVWEPSLRKKKLQM